MLTVALEREVEEYLERQRYGRHVDESEFRGYRNGYGRERQVTIGSGSNQSASAQSERHAGCTRTIRVKDPKALSKAFAETGGVISQAIC